MKSYDYYKKMQGIGSVRLRLGLSQEVFALELGISRSTLSKVENNQRTLPTTALIKLAALEISLAATVTSKMELRVQNVKTAACSVMHYYKELNCRADAERKQVDLEIMLINYNRFKTSFDQISLLIETAGERFLPGQLEILKYSLQQKIDKYGPQAQAALRHKIALLNAEASLHAVTQRTLGKLEVESENK
ncbi:MAG: helix-turn-helix transcriptional regulator [Rhizobacter sp.]|nr:helix-turn-helix transcriptional regulator [Ferruginibacter sp.]